MRGTAMTEFVIVAPFLGLLMASVVYFRDLHAGKIDAMRQAREAAWGQAYSAGGNCTIAGDVNNLLGGASGAVNAIGGGTLAGALGIANLFNFQTVRTTASNEIAGPSWGGGTVSGGAVVFCNEPDYGQDAPDVVQLLMQLWWNGQWN
jgi:hypothetical protein